MSRNGLRSLLLMALVALSPLLAASVVDSSGPKRLHRVTVQAGGTCEPKRPDCSIAAALEVLADGGTLELAPGRHPANLILSRDVTLQGAGAGATLLDGGGAGRVLTVEQGVRATVRGVTVTGGRLEKELERDGGGIWNQGILLLERSEVKGNVAIDDGGGVRNDGHLTIRESTVHGNEANRWGSVGGGIYSPVIATDPVLTVISSTISDNVAGDHGGGIWCEGVVTLINSTISGNSAAHTGGGIRTNGEFTARDSTIAFNRAGTTGGGIHHLGISTTLSGTLLAGNTAVEGGADCQGLIKSRGRNLVQAAEGCAGWQETEGDLLGVDPKLEPLADNGGPTRTHALAAGSPAIDRGAPSPVTGDGACSDSDQRGRSRPADGDMDGRWACDIGAFEVDAGPTASGRD